MTRTRLALTTIVTGLMLPATATARTTVYPATSHERAHAILLHGFTGDHTFYEQAPANTLLQGLRAQGYRVIVPDLPYSGPEQGPNTRARITQDADGGLSYTRQWRNTFRRLKRWTDKRYGHLPTIVGGISWGGWHAMQAACAMPSISGWFAISPVVDPGYLGELAGTDTGRMALGPCATRLRARAGSLSYGDQDTRVGVLPQRRLGALLRGRSVHVKCYPGLDHTTTPAAIERALRWAKRD